MSLSNKSQSGGVADFWGHSSIGAPGDNVEAVVNDIGHGLGGSLVLCLKE